MSHEAQTVVNEIKTDDYKEQRPSSLKRWGRLLWRSKTGTVGLIIVVLACLIALFAPILAPYEPQAINPANMLQPPFWMESGSTEHILGTDNLGRDIKPYTLWFADINFSWCNVRCSRRFYRGDCWLSFGIFWRNYR